MQRENPSRAQGFGLIGIMIAILIILFLVFGFQKLHPAEKLPIDDDTTLGTYEPVSPDGMKGQLEAGFQAKQSAQDTVKNLQDRVARDADDSR